jgi:tetrahydromethanopterin S-methyltransferase subunit F
MPYRAAGLSWGVVAASSLLVGALLAMRFSLSPRAVGLVMAVLFLAVYQILAEIA